MLYKENQCPGSKALRTTKVLRVPPMPGFSFHYLSIKAGLPYNLINFEVHPMNIIAPSPQHRREESTRIREEQKKLATATIWTFIAPAFHTSAVYFSCIPDFVDWNLRYLRGWDFSLGRILSRTKKTACEALSIAFADGGCHIKVIRSVMVVKSPLMALLRLMVALWRLSSARDG